MYFYNTGEISSDTTLGEEAIGQCIKTNGKPEGIRHVTQIPIREIESGWTGDNNWEKERKAIHKIKLFPMII